MFEVRLHHHGSGAVLVRERARGTVRVEERETHWLARGFFHAARALEVVEVRSGDAWGSGVDLDAGRLLNQCVANAATLPTRLIPVLLMRTSSLPK